VLTLKAVLPSSTFQTTQYIYGVDSASGSAVASNDLLKAVRYPDKTTGSASSSEQETFTYDALGEAKTYSDRIGNVHTYAYDVLGRQTSDAVTTLGSGVDGAIRRLTTTFNTQGLPELLTSYDASTNGNIVNQVQRTYKGLGQLTQEYQANDGAVNTSSTPSVQYDE